MEWSVSPERRAWLKRMATHVAVSIAKRQKTFTLSEVAQELVDDGLCFKSDVNNALWLTELRRAGPFEMTPGDPSSLRLIPAAARAIKPSDYPPPSGVCPP